MRLRNIPGAKDAIESSPYVIHEPAQNKGRWNEIFKNNHPIHIEVGMGKDVFNGSCFPESGYQLYRI